MTAAAGTRINHQTWIPEMPVRPGSSPVRRSIHGGRVPHLRGRPDLYVHLDVRTPTKLSGEEERMLREFARVRGEEVAELSRKQGGFLSFMRDAFNGQA
jgi:molecular chaperone DnaJ